MDLRGYRFFEMTQEQVDLFATCQDKVAENKARLDVIVTGLGYTKCEMLHSRGKFRGFIFPDGKRPKGWVKADRNHDAYIPGKRSKAKRELRDELLSLYVNPQRIFQSETGGTSFEFVSGSRFVSRGLWAICLTDTNVLGVPVIGESPENTIPEFKWTGEGQRELKPSEVLALIEDHNAKIAAQ